mmetsp:Transcript_25265/g.55233  ORF Transcript_25265/g.55233 Transcript_25265/m.55233 type:complete len:219 (-) Transcript_25265:1305-1961(-)
MRASPVKSIQTRATLTTSPMRLARTGLGSLASCASLLVSFLARGDGTSGSEPRSRACGALRKMMPSPFATTGGAIGPSPLLRVNRARSFSRKMKATMPAPQHSSKMNATSDPTSAPSTLSSSLPRMLALSCCSGSDGGGKASFRMGDFGGSAGGRLGGGAVGGDSGGGGGDGGGAATTAVPRVEAVMVAPGITASKASLNAALCEMASASCGSVEEER